MLQGTIRLASGDRLSALQSFQGCLERTRPQLWKPEAQDQADIALKLLQLVMFASIFMHFQMSCVDMCRIYIGISTFYIPRSEPGTLVHTECGEMGVETLRALGLQRAWKHVYIQLSHVVEIC